MKTKITSPFIAKALLLISLAAIICVAVASVDAQVSNNAVGLTLKRPAIPRNLPDPFKNFWFYHSFPVGEYEADVSISDPESLRFAADTSHQPVFLPGKGAHAFLFPGYTGEVCGDALVTSRYFCLPLKTGGVQTKLDIFARIKAVKAVKTRSDKVVTLWESPNFERRNLDLRNGVNDIRNLDFKIVRSVWVPAGYWLMFCQSLSTDGKLCGPGRGKQMYFYKSDNERIQPSHPSANPRKHNYALVGTGEPPPEPAALPDNKLPPKEERQPFPYREIKVIPKKKTKRKTK